MKRNGFTMFETLIVLIVIWWTFAVSVYMYWNVYTMLAETTEKLEAVETSVSDLIESASVDIPDIEVEVASEPVIEEEVEPVVEYFNVPLSEDLQDHIFAECEKYDVAPEMVIAMIERESRFDAGVIGDSGRSKGLMQIQERWHSERMEKLGCDDLLDPYQNVTVGIDFIAELIGCGKGVEWALMAYNGGPSYATRLAGNGIVSDYAGSVMARCASF